MISGVSVGFILSIFMPLIKKVGHTSLLAPPHSPNLGEVMLKSFIQTFFLHNTLERLVLTSQGTTLLLDGSMSQ
jgi:hypothetical protein